MMTEKSARKSPNQDNVPAIVIEAPEWRAWVGGLIQAEGCIQSHYVEVTDSTTVDITIAMTDPAPVIKFATLCGLPGPAKPKNTAGHRIKPLWLKDITGLRAYRILQEVLPHLYGEKKREAERALTFFDSRGYHKGHFVPTDIWPEEEFPLRRRRKYFPPASTESLTET